MTPEEFYERIKDLPLEKLLQIRDLLNAIAQGLKSDPEQSSASQEAEKPA